MAEIKIFRPIVDGDGQAGDLACRPQTQLIEQVVIASIDQDTIALPEMLVEDPKQRIDAAATSQIGPFRKLRCLR